MNSASDADDRVTKIFLKACDLPPSARSAFLDRACADDAELRAQVESLLVHDKAGAGLFASGKLDRVAAGVDGLPTETLDGTREPAPSGADSLDIEEYQILRRIGGGGMGSVYEAYDKRMKRRVAVKILSGLHAFSPNAERRFEREAWVGGRLNHPNLVKVFGRGVRPDGSFFSMELLEGGSLHDVIGNMRRAGRDERLNLEFGRREYVEWALHQMTQVTRALDYSHRQNVVHRDVKPMNLLLDADLAVVKVADFGLAVDFTESRLTASNQAMGTLTYMAPEQLMGRHHQIDARTDVYALGVTLFELLTLELPFDSPSKELYIRAALTESARRPSILNQRVSRDLETVILKALEKRPEDRYATAAALADDLENVLHFRPIRAHPPTPAVKLWKWSRRKPIHATLAALLLVGLPMLGFLSYRAVQHARVERRLKVAELWDEARSLSRAGRYAALSETASRILALDPHHVPALRSRALSFMHLAFDATSIAKAAELQQRSLDDIDRLESLAPGAAWPMRLKTHLLTKFGRAEEARTAEASAQLRRSDPRGDDDLFFDGSLAIENGHLEEAIHDLTELVARRPNWADAFALRAEAHEENKDLGRAIADFRVARGLSPESANFAFDLGRLLTATGELDEGALQLRGAIELAPSLAIAQEGLSDNLTRQGQRAASEGDSKSALGLFRQAELHARRSMELDPNPRSSWAQLNLGASLLEQARLLDPTDQQKIAEAIGHFEAVISSKRVQDARYALAVLNLCDALIQSRQLDSALGVCLRATELLPADASAQYNLAGVYALLGRPDDATRALERDFELGDRDWAYLSTDPWFESVRHHRRFLGILGRMQKPDLR